MKKITLAAALLLASTVAASAQTSIGGKYTVEGTNLDGSTYSGTAEVTLTSETTCTIHWETGSTTSDGICMRNDESFAASYVSGDIFGLVIYKVAPDGSMTGLWTIANNGGAGTEILKPAQ
jgi:hypothetical protein